VVGRRRWCNGETYIFPFFSQSFFSLPVIYHHRRRSSVHSCSSKNYKTYEFSKISLWWHTSIREINIIIKISLKKKFLLSLSVVVGRWCNGETYKNFFLSKSSNLQNLCVIYYPRGFSQSTAAPKTTKLIKKWCVLSFIHCGNLQ
jgi:hypothetical protein